MSIHALPTRAPGPDLEPDLEHQDLITNARACFLAELAAGLRSLERAAATLGQLRGPRLADIELVDGRDGRDIATHLDNCIRQGRAAYAVMHAVIDKETP
jgi:hypothetical protein